MYNRPNPDDDSPAEIKVYKWLKKLPDEVSVVYSWNFSPRKGIELQADFVVIAPTRAAPLVIEVKGGGISRTGTDWTSTNRKGKVINIKNPIKQAQDAAFNLSRQIFDNDRHKAWGLAFPDTKWDTNANDLPRDLVINLTDLSGDPWPSIERVFANHNIGWCRPNQKFVEKAISLVVPSVSSRK